jgi:membrane protein required for colicin V production
MVFGLSAVGLIRGFLKEVTSIINWFGSFYLTSKIKPSLTPLLQDKIKIPFLLDVVVNIILFATLTIALSIIGNYLISAIKKIVPTSTNSSLGFLFGFLKGILISGVTISFLSIVYQNSDNKPYWLNKSHIYNSMGSSSMFKSMLENILGDLMKLEDKKKESSDDGVQQDKIIDDTISLDNLGGIEKLINVVVE